MDVAAWGEYRLLGATRDDAAGEAFDKVAKLLELPYPGGPHIERIAKEGDPSRVRFSRPMLRASAQPGDADYYDVSFSGLKTAVLNAVKNAELPRDRADIARGFQDALIDTLVEKTLRAARTHGRTRIVLGGGVACNRTLAARMQERANEIGARVYAPPVRLATDNAAMIARAGLFHFERGERASNDLNAYATLPIPGLVTA
jgi:N6-L-threonylcarbamoyladenine synthase